MSLPLPKRLVGRCLFSVCESFPATKPFLGRWGMRTKKEWFVDRVVTVQTPEGRTFRLASFGQNHLSFELFWKGTGYYEPISTLVAQQLSAAGGTFLDVGANIGFYSLVLSTANRELDVIAFEPNPENFALLQRNVTSSALSNIRCEPIALSDADGTATLYLSPSAMSASLRPDFEQHRGGGVTVPTAKLDSYVEQHQIRGRMLIKVDVEGAERAFFEGARQTLALRRPDVITEVTMAYDRDVLGFLTGIGYRFYQITDRGLVPSRELEPVVRGRLVFLNYLLSTKSPIETAQLFNRIATRVGRIDLTRTSKCLSPDAVEKFIRRAAKVPAG